MVEENDDFVPYTLEEKLERLQYAILLAHHSIPTIVWAEDALAYIANVPTYLFDKEILVEDHLVENAAKIILENLPYELHPEPLGYHRDTAMSNRERPTCFPRSVILTPIRGEIESLPDPPPPPPHIDPSSLVDDPPIMNVNWLVGPEPIVIHPASFFQFDIRNRTRSVALDGIPDDVRCPTWAAFTDAVIDSMLDPPHGYFHEWFNGMMRIYHACLAHYNFPMDVCIPGTNELKSEIRAAVDTLREDNRLVFEGMLRNQYEPMPGAR